jgi:LuxR family maltose regulon positive regulatory protein
VTRTKIIVPRRRAELLSRQRLLDMLFELLDDKLIIIAAPAGSGKTSLLIDFIHFVNWPVCWLALDPLDQDPQRFIAHFIAALNVRFPTFGKSSLAALESTTQDRLNLDSIISLIVNDVYENITEYFLVVLDDYHLVEDSKPVNTFVNRFIQEIDENCHLVIASRTLLSLPDMPLMVARSQVGGLSFAELAFQPDEIQRLLLKNYHLPVTDSEASELARDTEGWVTGLLLSTQLAAGDITERLRVARVSGVGLYEYLAQQVLERQPVAVQDFLLWTSMLEEFDARMCAEVIGAALVLDENWQELMEIILRQNLFVLPVGEEGLFLRYHHLFRDFLQSRLLRDRPQEAVQIQVFLAEYFIRQQEWERAYAVYHKLGNNDSLPLLIIRAGPTMIARGRLVTLSEWLQALPSKTLKLHPELLSLQGSLTALRGDTNQGLVLLNEAVALLRQGIDFSELGQALVRRSSVHRLLGEYGAALEDAEAALALDLDITTANTTGADALYAKGMALFYQGNASEAQVVIDQAISAYQSVGDEQTRIKATMDAGMVAKKIGQYAKAEKSYRKALDYYQATGNLYWQANLFNNLGVLQHLLGSFADAINSLEKAVQYAEIAAYPRLRAYGLASIGDLYRDLDAQREAAEAYKRSRLLAQQVNERYLLFYLNLAEGALARLQGDIPTAQEYLRAAQAIADVGGSHSDQNLCRLEQAAQGIAGKDYQAAIAGLQEAAAFYDSAGYPAESVRAHLYMAVACFETGKPAAALDHLSHLTPYLNETPTSNHLVTAAREVSSYLERMQANSDLNSIATLLIHKIEAFEQKQVPTVRRLLRRQSQVIPFAPPKLLVYGLGKVQVKIADTLVTTSDWKVQTARDLFFLLLAHPEGFTKEEIGGLFWPEATPAEFRLRFKNVMYRMRHAVGKDVVLFEDDIYCFNRAMDYEFDIDHFNKEIVLAQKTIELDAKIGHLQAAIKIYRGDYLPGLEASWVVIERERLHQTYVDALLKLAELYLAKGAYEPVLTCCQRVLKDDHCHESAHRLAMRVYAAMGNRVLLIRQYEQCRKALLEEIKAPPSVQTQALYGELVR